MQSNNISFHKATWLGCLFLLRLRNKPETYKYFKNDYPVRFLEHLKWFSELMSKDSNKQLFVITVDENKAGQIRFDKLEKGRSDISISILKEHMGQHVMSSIFPDVVKSYIKKNKDIKKLTAKIKEENTASVNFFRKFGFKKFKKMDNGWLVFSRKSNGF